MYECRHCGTSLPRNFCLQNQWKRFLLTAPCALPTTDCRVASFKQDLRHTSLGHLCMGETDWAKLPYQKQKLKALESQLRSMDRTRRSYGDCQHTHVVSNPANFCQQASIFILIIIVVILILPFQLPNPYGMNVRVYVSAYTMKGKTPLASTNMN